MTTSYIVKIWFINAQRFATLDDLGIDDGISSSEWSTSMTHTSKLVAIALAKSGVALINREWEDAGLSLPVIELVIFFSVDGSKFIESERLSP